MTITENNWQRAPGHTPGTTVSIVIPVYNERDVLPFLYKRLRLVLEQIKGNYEIVFVDDGSNDGSSDYLNQLAMLADNIVTVGLSRNFGKEAALTAGLLYAEGEAVIILDADLQDPPELIPEMLGAWRNGADIVCMKRKTREGETWAKRASAYTFYRFLNWISGVRIPEDTGDFRLMSRRALDALNKLPERNRYMKGLFAWVGFPTTVLEYNRAPRAAGTTKCDYLKLLGLAFEGITSFSITPLRWMTVVGLLTAAMGAFLGIWIVIKTLVMGADVSGYPSIMAIITFLGGVQLLSIGVVGEYVGKTYVETKQRPVFLVREVVGKSHMTNTRSYLREERLHAAAR
jgi:glycosyltransferase involved in cell wall biosynthesis